MITEYIVGPKQYHFLCRKKVYLCSFEGLFTFDRLDAVGALVVTISNDGKWQKVNNLPDY